ncbi:hypothetical protein [Photobacterium kishitanii]|uniref:hypothetical protein n=1 Tax=Photobacterium kishitanii TaxID=318456 RepID=UPI0007F930BB|nr:hypothetical protein [Photobacterium kishitanii]OBU31453.1 hypothetical protein AYY23_19525 [Photobacterium kishitanii]
MPHNLITYRCNFNNYNDALKHSALYCTSSSLDSLESISGLEDLLDLKCTIENLYGTNHVWGILTNDELTFIELTDLSNFLHDKSECKYSYIELEDLIKDYLQEKKQNF